MVCAFKPCSLEINSNGKFQREHMESCSSTTKNTISSHWSCKIMWRTKKHISTTRVPVATKPTWTVAQHERLLLKKLQDALVLRDYMTNENHYISTIAMRMATKVDRMVTYLEELLPIKSHDPLITCSCKITWQTIIISAPNLVRW